MVTFLLVTIGWVFFRAADLVQSRQVLAQMFTGGLGHDLRAGRGRGKTRMVRARGEGAGAGLRFRARTDVAVPGAIRRVRLADSVHLFSVLRSLTGRRRGARCQRAGVDVPADTSQRTGTSLAQEARPVGRLFGASVDLVHKPAAAAS